jgi:hypothetical protein
MTNEFILEAVMHWIYQLNRARVVRGERVILDDVTVSFLPDAKIGVDLTLCREPTSVNWRCGRS